MPHPSQDSGPDKEAQRHLASLGLLSHVANSLSGSDNSGDHGFTNFPDVTLVAFGREYELHKLILVQSGFFHSLFCASFRESDSRVWSGERPRIPITIPDPNMSRPAFEFCLATLYGCAPTIKLPGWMNPTHEHPLGTGYPSPAQWSSPVPSTQDGDQDQPHPGFENHTALLSEQEDAECERGHGHEHKNEQERGCGYEDPHQDEKPPDEGILGALESGGVHWATPRFLLSLLATSTYLGVPAVTSLSLTLILASFTPYTATAYLRFGLGLGILPGSTMDDSGGDVEEELVQPLAGRQSMSCPARYSGRTEPSPVSPSAPLFYGPATEKIKEAALCWLARWASDLWQWERDVLKYATGHCFSSFSSCSSATASASTGSSFSPQPPRMPSQNSARSSHRQSNSAVSNSRAIDEADSSGWGSTSATDEAKSRQMAAPPPPYPIIWGFDPHRGIPSSTVRTLISSDSFYIQSEWDRYHLARHVVHERRKGKMEWMDLSFQHPKRLDNERRKQRHGSGGSYGDRPNEGPEPGVDPEAKPDFDVDEEEYRRLFAEGVYYTHMNFEQLSMIAKDICPLTDEPYTPSSVLQNALWAGMEVRTAVTESGKLSDLGVSLEDIAPQDGERNEHKKPTSTTASRWALQRLFPIPEDRTSKSGDSLGQLEPMIQAQMQALSHLSVNLDDLSADPAGTCGNASGLAAQRDLFAVPVPLAPTTPSIFHVDLTLRGHELIQRAENRYNSKAPGLTQHMPAARTGAASRLRPWRRPVTPDSTTAEPPPQEIWSRHEPMRFGVEFFSIDRLPQRTRLYSPTVFYGGSWWNLYIVTVQKPKGIQLGIYLHRQSPGEKVPDVSPPPADVLLPPTKETTLHNREKPITPHSIWKTQMENLFLSIREPSARLDLLDELVPSQPPQKPYIDERRSVRACFSIHCFSPLGNGLTCFSSGPDHFTLSQSWGWKSSTLLRTVFLRQGTLDSATRSWDNRFRCVCTIVLI